MIYIYAGEDLYSLETSLKHLYEEYHIDKDHRVVIEASDKRGFNINQVLIECDTFSLFDDDTKAVIVKDPFFLFASSKEVDKISKSDSASVKKRKENEIQKRDERLSKLESYLLHENKNTVLIFLCHGYNADSRKKDYKLLTKYHAKVVSFPKMDEKDFTSYARNCLKEEGIEVTNDVFQEILSRCGSDTLLLQQAIEKLKLYGNQKPDLNDVKHLISLNSEVNVFKLTTAFGLGDVQGCFEAIDEMLLASYDYNAMISMLSKRLRTIFNIKVLYEKGYSNEEIATRMHLNSKGQVYYVLKDSSSMNSRKILKYLSELADIDQGIKQGELNAKDAFEDFILRNTQRKQVGYYHG